MNYHGFSTVLVYYSDYRHGTYLFPISHKTYPNTIEDYKQNKRTVDIKIGRF